MKSWQILFREAPAGRNSSGAQGESTSDGDFDDAADDALVEEGEAELAGDDDEEEEEAESEEEEEQSEEDQDDLDEEEEEDLEEVEDEEEEASAAGFKFKDPKTGDFDFKRINKAVGGPELEKAFKEQTATITRTSQENKTLRDQLASPELKTAKDKAGFLDHLVNSNPVIHKEVMRVLQGGSAGQEPAGGGFEIPGLDPNDPVAPVLQQVMAGLSTIQNRLQDGDKQRQAQERDNQFVNGLRGARAKFKELTGSDPTEEQLLQVAQEMNRTNLPDGAAFVPNLFLDLIRKAERQKFLATRKVKKNLPKTGSTGRVPAKGKGKVSREEEFDSLWEEHMG